MAKVSAAKRELQAHPNRVKWLKFTESNFSCSTEPFATKKEEVKRERKSEAVRLRKWSSTEETHSTAKTFLFISLWIVYFAIYSRMQLALTQTYFLLCGILMHGRRHRAISLPEKLLDFLAFFVAFLSLKTKFIFNAPPHAPAKAFYLYLLHDTTNFSRKNGWKFSETIKKAENV